MKSLSFTKSNRSDNVLHIETEGAIVNIYVGLHDGEGREVTTIEVLPDNADRGGEWSLGDAADQRAANVRLVRNEPK